MTIKKKVLISSAFTIFISLFSIGGYFYVQNEMEDILEQDTLATKITTNIDDFSVVVNDFLLDPYGDANVKWLENYERVAISLKSLDATDESSKRILTGIFELMDEIRSTFSEMVVYSRQGQYEESAYVDFDPEIGISNMRLASERLTKEISDLKLRYNLSLERTITAQGRALLLIIIALILIAVLNSFYLAKYIATNLSDLAASLKDLGKNNFEVNLPNFKRDDEIGALVEAMNIMLKEIQSYQGGLEGKIAERTAELTRAKAQSDAVLANIGDGLAVIDPSYNVVLINKAAERILGWAQSEVLGQNWLKITQLADEEGKPVKENLIPSIAAARSQNGVVTAAVRQKYSYKTKDGTFRLVSITASRMTLNNQFIGTVVVFRDITEEVKVDKAKTDFVTLASHQLRTPVTAISWLSESLIAKSDSFDEENRDALSQIFTANKRMINIMNSLLNVARIDMGLFKIEPKQTDVKALVQKLVEDHISSNKNLERDVEIVTQLPEEEMALNFDPDVAYVCFDNLVSNAVKYTPDKGRVVVRTKFVNAGEMVGGKSAVYDMFIFEVEDNGYGIPRVEQEKIFTKLYRAANIRDKDTDGSGLGLYIVKSVVVDAGGDVWFQSEEGKGTTFYLSFPKSGMFMRQGTQPLEK